MCLTLNRANVSLNCTLQSIAAENPQTSYSGPNVHDTWTSLYYGSFDA